MKLLKFESKIGYSELAAFVALVLSGYALYQSSDYVQYREKIPRITITEISYEKPEESLSGNGLTNIYIRNDGKYPVTKVTLAFPLYHLPSEKHRPEDVRVSVEPNYKYTTSVHNAMAFVEIAGPIPPAAEISAIVFGDPVGITVFDEHGHGCYIFEGEIRKRI